MAQKDDSDEDRQLISDDVLHDDITNETYLSKKDKDIDIAYNICTKTEDKTLAPHPMKIHWVLAPYLFVLHVIFAVEICKILLGYHSLSRIIQVSMFAYWIGILGVSAGAHRLWTHRSFKAKWPLRMFLLILHTISGQMSVYTWVQVHRIHHKFTDTDADPHNIKRGFFFSQIGWLLVHKHPEVEKMEKIIDMSDLQADPVIMFQHRIYPYIADMAVLILPTLLFQYFWGTSFRETFCFAGVFRYLISLHTLSLINSYAHYFGTKPYDRRMTAVNPPLIGLVSDERWHNYHHAFPWDYRSNELNSYSNNVIKLFIDVCAWIGLAYDLKTVDQEMIKKRVLRTGDGSHPLWGWGDKDTTEDHIKATVTINSKKKS